MISYRDIFDLDDTDIIPPVDEKSDNIYRQSKLDVIRTEAAEGSDAGRMNSFNFDEGILEPADPEYNDAKGMAPSTDMVVRKIEEGTGSTVNHGSSGSSSANWKLRRVIADAHQGWVRCIDIDPITNKWFVTGGSDATIKVWDLATLQIKATITGHIMGVRSLKVSSRFPYLFSGSEDKTVRCWDLERTNSAAGSQIRDYHGHVGGIYAMDLHPDLDLLVTGGRDSAIRVWDIRSRVQVMVLTGHRSDVTSIQCASSDPQIVSSSMDATIRLWDLRKATTQLTLTHHSKSIRLMLTHPHEATMCSADTGGNFKQWVLPRGDLLNEFSTEEDDSKIVNTLSINPVTNSLFAGYDDGKMEFYDYVSGKLLQRTYSKPVPGSSDKTTIYASKFDRLGSRFITCEGDKSIKVWAEE